MVLDLLPMLSVSPMQNFPFEKELPRFPPVQHLASVADIGAEERKRQRNEEVWDRIQWLESKIEELKQKLEEETTTREALEMRLAQEVIMRENSEIKLNEKLQQELELRHELEYKIKKLKSELNGGSTSDSLSSEERPEKRRKETKEEMNEDSFRPFKSWDDHFEELKEFKRLNGHCNVPKTKTKRETWSLANWVSMQRAKRKTPGARHGTLTPLQIQKLDSIGFEWDRSYYTFGRHSRSIN